ANDAILVTSIDDLDAPHGPAIVYCNAAFTKTSGWSRPEIMGLTPRVLQNADTNRTELDRLKAVLVDWRAGDTSRPARAELLNITKSGAPFWVEFQIARLQSESGDQYFAAIQRDVTDRVQREQVVREALRREERAGAARDEFIAKMSHDMRTPLNAIMGFSELLQSGHGGPLSSKQAAYAADIGRAAHQLHQLVGDLLDANALERGALSINGETLLANELIDYALGVTHASAARRAVSLRVRGAISAPLFGDAVRARQCLTNVIENAIKYSPPGASIAIDVTSLDDRTAIAVSDQGPGMSDADVATALSLFGQVGQDMTTAAGGVGLGLPITLKLMRLQGGDLHVLSQLGVGSTFTLVFPQARTPGPNRLV
ncbi:MAG: ATP-binding protein, partial [Pseudomonadota bacterium]